MEEKFAICRSVHKRFLNDPKYEMFRDPVKWEELGLYEYRKIVKRPMDLSTIDKKLNNREYCTPSEYIFDMRLIYRNCLTFNTDSPALCDIAQQFIDEFEKIVKEKKLYDFAYKIVPKKSEEQTKQFIYAMQHADPKVLGIVVNAVSLIAPDCIVYGEGSTCDIDVSKMDGSLVEYFLGFLVSVSS